MNTQTYPGNGKILLYTLVFILLGLIVGVGGPYLLHLELRNYSTYMKTLPPFFTRSTGAGAMYAAPLVAIFLFVLSYIGIYRIFSGKTAPVKLADTLVRGMVILAVVALIGLFVGRFVANSYWDGVFRQAGYSRCPNSFFLTSKWFTDAWVRDPTFCRDQEVKRMMTSTKFKVKDVNNYLRERKPVHSF